MSQQATPLNGNGWPPSIRLNTPAANQYDSDHCYGRFSQRMDERKQRAAIERNQRGWCRRHPLFEHVVWVCIDDHEFQCVVAITYIERHEPPTTWSPGCPEAVEGHLQDLNGNERPDWREAIGDSRFDNLLDEAAEAMRAHHRQRVREAQEP